MLKIVDGLREKPHVTSNDHFGRNEGIVGISDYVLNVGRLFETELISSNALRIYDGEGMIQGCHWRILPGTYETVTLRNGTQGKKRIDYVVARYEKNSVGYEDIGISVKEGEATSGNPKPPAYITGDIRAGDTIREMVLAEIEYEGINVVAVTPKFEVLMTMAELQEKTDELNRKLPACNEIYTGVANHAQYDIPDITPYDLLVIYGGPGTYANTSVVIPVESIVYKDDGQFALGVHQSSTTFWELEFNFPTSTKINIANYKNQSWTTPAIRKILAVKL